MPSPRQEQKGGNDLAAPCVMGLLRFDTSMAVHTRAATRPADSAGESATR
jgi:hypothetical protein